MPELEITVGGRSFTVACQDGEEAFLQAAAAMLDREAQTLLQSGTRLPADRLLLMAGLMVADRTIGADEELRAMDRRLADQGREIDALKARPAFEKAEPQEVRVEVVPDEALRRLDELAERAEAVAARVADDAA